MHQYEQKPATQLSQSTVEFLKDVSKAEYAVLVGRNNCGKSFILKTLTAQIGQNASYLGPARYQNFQLLGNYTPNRNRKADRWRQFIDQWNKQTQNIDNSPLNLQQAISELSDSQRDTLREIVRTLLGTDLEILHTVPNNSMSQKYISCGGHNISFTSSGFRLITALVTSLLDTDYDTFLIDEPELGISPEAQGLLADFLFNKAQRAKFFSHIKTLILATHSTIFLDRANISNNYCVEKRGNEIHVQQVANHPEFNQIHFFLLGNRFETLYLPSTIILVEGKCDYGFIERIVSSRYKPFQLSVIPAHSDSRIKEILSIARGLLTDIQKSPYKDRIIVVLDSVHSASLPSELQRMGILPDNIIVWPKNGIEYYYPPLLLDEIFGVGADIEITGDTVSRNGISYAKSELLAKVLSRINDDTEMHPEFETRFLQLINQRIGL